MHCTIRVVHLFMAILCTGRLVNNTDPEIKKVVFTRCITFLLSYHVVAVSEPNKIACLEFLSTEYSS